MAKIKGKNIIVMAGGVALAACKSCEIETECELKEYASPSSSDARNYLAGRTSWQITTNHLISSGYLSTFLKKPGQTVTIVIGEYGDDLTSAIGATLTGMAIVAQARVTATTGNLAQGSWKFQGTGPLT